MTIRRSMTIVLLAAIATYTTSFAPIPGFAEADSMMRAILQKHAWQETMI